ncbi:hypothetical protein [Streptomyces sp. NPDC056045]|uniref:hypothetical protein n=1 Tax=Streptomyces sp. NPDC056045 TaxID=3345691 RepID=UPI0035E2F2AC
MSVLSNFAASLPAPGPLRARARVLTLLEAAFGSRWPRYSHAAADGSGFEHFWYENGGGDDYHVFLGPSTAFLRAFDHESWMSPYSEDELCPGLLDGLPEDLTPLTRLENDEPKFPALTLALWHDGTAWRHGDPRPGDGREPELTSWMLAPLVSFTPDALTKHFGHYYSRPVDTGVLEALVAGAPVDRDLVERLAPGTAWEPVEKLARRLDAPARCGGSGFMATSLAGTVTLDDRVG